MLHDILLIVVGLLFLIKGGDYLIKSSVSIAQKARLDPMVIGLTIVAFGTSAPEFLVSLQAAFKGSSGIAIGNIVGSNIANIALILGLTAAISAVPVKKITLLIDMPFLILSSGLMVWAAMGGTIERWQGIIGILLLIGFTGWQIRHSRKQKQKVESIEKPMNPWLAVLIVILSCTALTFGADWLVNGASGVARTIGKEMNIAPDVMERIIGLTVVAVGTSLPELFASVSAARKGETGMAIGNVIGSNIFNILCVVGASAAIHPITGSNQGFLSDYVWMLAVTVLLWILLRTGRKLSRTEGFLLIGLYIVFIVLTVINR